MDKLKQAKLLVKHNGECVDNVDGTDFIECNDCYFHKFCVESVIDATTAVLNESKIILREDKLKRILNEI